MNIKNKIQGKTPYVYAKMKNLVHTQFMEIFVSRFFPKQTITI